ncbi:MAG: RNA polymerase factor sigma-54 [Chlorobiaceae bacterium]|jgi:RNA polymerase sigma-54 factor|nr:RNA polymerase factor sigma-54 [Chlorobiaceae bacterium]
MGDLKLQLKQKTLLSAQQILGSQLLHLPLVNLEQRIDEELQENPLLEMVDEERDNVADFPVDVNSPAGDELSDPIERFSSISAKESVDSPFLNERYERGSTAFNTAGSGDRFFQAVQYDSFHEQLLKQLVLQEDIGEKEILIAVEVLGNLDHDDYLTEDISVIRDGLRLNDIDVSESEVQKIIYRIAHLDPQGIAVRDLRERLLVQLQSGEFGTRKDASALALRILMLCFDDFLHKRYNRLLKKIDVSKEQLEAALEVLGELDPHPGGVFQNELGHYIVPDFIVNYEQGELTATLNDNSALSVKVSDKYESLLKNRKASKDEKQFIRSNLQRAKEFTSALQLRRQTLIKVIEALLRYQYGFFVSGPSFLVPLGMKTIAEAASLDISTISRAVNGKYVQTRFGVFELKYFFSGGLATEEGDDLSSKIIKQYIGELVSGEDPQYPLSDEMLTELLKKKGIHIARRTVAKYREQMQISVARLRKKIF